LASLATFSSASISCVGTCASTRALIALVHTIRTFSLTSTRSHGLWTSCPFVWIVVFCQSFTRFKCSSFNYHGKRLLPILANKNCALLCLFRILASCLCQVKYVNVLVSQDCDRSTC
jgi:hypothetical protein